MRRFVLPILATAGLLGGCNSNGDTTNGSSSAITPQQAVNIGCALAQVLGDVAGKTASDVNASAADQAKIVNGRQIATDACTGLIAVTGLFPPKSATASVSSTVTLAK